MPSETVAPSGWEAGSTNPRRSGRSKSDLLTEEPLRETCCVATPLNSEVPVFELRTVLESHVVKRLAEDATDEQIEQLRNVLDRQRASVGDQVDFLRLDEEFHLLMPELIGHWRTHQMLSTLRGAMWLIGGTALKAPSRSPDVISEHAAILAALEAHDSEAAAFALTAHMDSTATAAARNAV